MTVPRPARKKVRIGGRFKVELNGCLKLQNHPPKSIRQAFDNLGTGNEFTKLDISSEDQRFSVVNTQTAGRHRSSRKLTFKVLSKTEHFKWLPDGNQRYLGIYVKRRSEASALRGGKAREVRGRNFTNVEFRSLEPAFDRKHDRRKSL